MKRIIKINFVDFWSGFHPEKNFFIDRLSLYFDVQLDSNPEFLFYSWNGIKNLSYRNCVKIYFTGENDIPDFNTCDYAIGFHHITFSNRYFRLPLFVLYSCFGSETEQKVITEAEKSTYLNRKFCSFVVSNSKAADPAREQFFKKLCEYKKVDSGGKILNNTGYRIPDKEAFIKEYKFNIAFENSEADGYTTEKLLQPLTAHTIPIYWGNPKVELDFNKKAFVCVNDFESIEKAIEEIIRLDTNDGAYLEMLSQPYFCAEHKNHSEWIESFDTYICSVLNQPFEKAKRITEYGFSRYYRNRRKLLEMAASLPGLKQIIRKLSYKF